MTENTELLDTIIFGYVPHKLYAFSTAQANGYLKVGETSRSVPVRLKEWQTKIADLNLEKEWLAMLPKDSEEQREFFQDFALHKYFKNNGFRPLDPQEAPGNSKEFYPVTVDDVENGIITINEDYVGEPPHEYTFLSIEDKSRVIERWERTKDFQMRDNQQKVVDNLLSVVGDPSVTPNYLLFAVMRFGKTFVALQAAKALDSKLTVVVSAKADVKSEWQQNLESHNDFEGFIFLDSESLVDSETTLSDALSDNKVVLFLTLQDLNGHNVKEKHKQLFDNNADLLIVDESHFGARAQSYGQVIYESDDKENNDEVKALDNVKEIARRYTLHLSGTPYRILMGNEFSNPKQIVGKVQFEDILDEKAKWYEEHLNELEWNNPYFGFPQMVRFAFNLSDEAKQRVDKLTSEGKKGQLNELFGPISNDKNDTEDVKFKHESYVLETLQALDGSVNSKSIFPILNYEKLKDGKMARHIVMVLPYKASCDAMEKLFENHRDKFINFKDYEILNIAGHNSSLRVDSVKKMIRESAIEGKKTISLTVNKMLTGVTVPQWDTMIYLKDTQSPQEYDQAIYRLQSPYVTIQVDSDNNMVNKEDLKPQTLLIDFSPNRMMNIEQYKAFVLTASDGKSGNEKVENALVRQMNTSPIITINNDKLTQVQPTDILKYIAAYSSEKGIIEEAGEISVDLSILDNVIIKSVIEYENEIGSKPGIKFRQNKDSEEEADLGDVDSEDDGDAENGNNGQNGDDHEGRNEPKDEQQILAKKIQNYYLRILFYAFLSEETEINNLSDVISTYDNNERLAGHLGLEKSILQEIEKTLTNPWVRSDLDNKISNANALLADNSVDPSEKVARAIKSFKRISESEVFTPRKIVESIVNLLLEEIDFTNFDEKPKLFIDIASKSGIYLLVLYNKLLEKGVNPTVAKNCLYSVTTSPVAYEFTRKIYELMEFPIEHILDIERASSYELIKDKERPFVIEALNQYYFKGDEEMKFDVVVGNPPYNESDKDDGKGSSKPLYNLFIDLARKMNPDNISLITPSVWFLGGKGLDSFRQSMLSDIHFKDFENYITAKDVFGNVNLRGGVNYFVWSSDYDNSKNGVTVKEYQNNKLLSSETREYTIEGLNLFISDNIGFRIIKRFIDEGILDVEYEMSEKILAMHVSERNPFGYPTTFKKFENEKGDGTQYKIYRSGGKTGFVTKCTMTKGEELVDKIKVITPFANNIGTDLPDDNLNTQVIGKDEIVTETYLVIGAKLDLSVMGAQRLEKYLKTKFVRYLIGLAKANQNGTRQTYRFVPVQDFSGDEIDWSKSISEIDKQLYKKYDLGQSEIDFIEDKVKKMG